MPCSPLANPSTTLAVLSAHGIAMKKSLGQHFLIDDNIVRRTLELAALSADDVVLEVGPGIGTLTVPLCAAARRVVAVERDARLLPVLEETTSGCGTLTVVRADATTVGSEALTTDEGSPTTLVANLPYGVAATVVLRFFEVLPTLSSATVMVQAEVADRMTARPGTKDYGAYTVKLRLLAEPAGRFSVPRTVFLPPPRVGSAVVRLCRVDRGLTGAAFAATSRVAAAAFAQRRKTLRNSLASDLGAPVPLVEKALSDVGIDARSRAEEHGVHDYVTLADALHRAGAL